MGIYLLEPLSIQYVEPDVFFDLPALVLCPKEVGEAVKGCIHTDYWLDIGRPEDYEAANRDIDSISEMFNL
jgi:NDP-sugar pyrophosphorylase family protein